MTPAVLRRMSLVAMIVAIVAGAVSLWLLFTSPAADRTMAVVSVVALVIGLGIDWRARKLDENDVG